MKTSSATAATLPEPQADDQPAGKPSPFPYGTEWVRADFHLHTKVDKEFQYKGDEGAFVPKYVEQLKSQGIRLGLITNHNKFHLAEFKALRKRARKEGICLLPGVELSVNDGANGVHTLIAFSDDWIDGGDHINQFLSNAFSGKVPAQYEQENGRSNDSIIQTLQKLESYNRDFFIIFAHVEAASGLWKEIDGGRLQELAANPLVQKYCLGFQKVRTHDKPDAKCRVKVQQWWGARYPAEVEGSDPKKLDEIGRGQHAFVKIGDLSFDAVKYALKDFRYRVASEEPAIEHSYVSEIVFEGGLLDGQKAAFSPHLNCVIGIRGSGKSAVIESLRYALGINLATKAEDRDYKTDLVPYALKSGGKVIVRAVDRHGTEYEIHRLIGHHSSDVYVDGKLTPGIAVRETIIRKPVYFGQKDLSAAGKTFGNDLVEKLVGDDLKVIRSKIAAQLATLKATVASYSSAQSQLDELGEKERELADVKYQLQQFDKHGVKDKLEKQIEFGNDIDYCEQIDALAASWQESVAGAVEQAEEELEGIEAYESKYNAAFFKKYEKKADALKATIKQGKTLHAQIEKIAGELGTLREELETTRDGLKDEFAETARQLLKLLKDQGITSIQPDDYVKLTQRKAKLEARIAELKKTTSKQKGREEALLQALAQLNEGWRDEFKAVNAALDQINATQSELKVTATFKGDKDAFRAKLEEKFKGSSIKKEAYQAIAEKYADFGEVFKDLDDAAKLTKTKADAFKETFQEMLGDLLGVQIPNSYEVTYHGKALKSHSLGQRASAMMLFILSQKDKDLLIIDQPEDDLDSQTVYEEVVKLLRDIKSSQQFIFATHNANFPVLGDAEAVSSCIADGETITVETGSIDSRPCQEKIVRIMEGGREAFERRKTIYQIWSSGAKPPA
jgi:predicted ATPase